MALAQAMLATAPLGVRVCSPVVGVEAPRPGSELQGEGGGTGNS